MNRLSFEDAPFVKGKVKTIFQTDKPDEVLIQYEDRVTAGNGEKEDYPQGKGAICCEISSIIFKKLEEVGVKTHYLGMPTHRSMLCRKVDIIPLEVICRNFAAGSIVRTTTINEGTAINPPIVEFFLKDDSKNDPLLTMDRVRLMGYDPQPLIEATHSINSHLLTLFTLMGIDLIDFKVEFGYDNHGDLYLADEISPDSMRLWKKGTRDRYDKDLFRDDHYVDEGDILPAYEIILQKLRGFA